MMRWGRAGFIGCRKNFSKKRKKGLDKFRFFAIIIPVHAGVAHPVERHLAKVEVASSSLVTRSSMKKARQLACFFVFRAGAFRLLPVFYGSWMEASVGSVTGSEGSSGTVGAVSSGCSGGTFTGGT